MDISLANQFIFLSTTIMGLWLSFWVYRADRKKKINQYFFAMVLVWIFGEIVPYFIFRNILLPQKILFFLPKIEVASIFLFFIFFYFFTIHFLQEEKKFPPLNKIITLTALIGIFLAIFTNLFQKAITINETGLGLDLILTQSGKIIWLGFVITTTLFIFFRFLLNYIKSTQENRPKVQYFLIGISIWIAINFVFNVYFPLIQNTFIHAYLGNYSIVILFGFTAYAIVRHKLFGIKIILTSLFVALIAILLLLDLFLLTTEPLYQLFKGLIVFIFIYFGFMLIKSVKEEVKRREDAEILSRAKSEFISMASHQLRTPLTVIKGYVSMILDGSYGKINIKTKKVLGNVAISTERLVKIIEDLLNISRIELGKMDLEKKPTDIKKMIDSICQEIKIKAKEKNLELIWKKPKAQLPKLNIDELKIRQVIYNIIDNAIKYTETGKVEIKLSRENSNLVINISDTGRGFSKEDNTKLFELFSRGEAGTDTFVEGTGMGLYVAKKFVNLHKGKIWADSKGKNKGSAFHIELPIK